ncbi:glycoside hydrolase family 88 protein [Parapedobacter tibetensis]|nr:glycoside hydrolase family 88 protein [Parapedobacter tibetensis]
MQKIGDQPEPATYEDTDGFGVGAFLLAASELLKLK